jgi:hypothetical protein
MTASMTGFAAHSINLDPASVNIDLRSVNQRFLELHFRLADEFRPLEPQLRELINQRLARGKVECRISLTVLPTATLDNGLNPGILERLASWQADVLQRLPDSARLSVNDILRWPGAVQTDALSQEALNEAALAAMRATLDELVESRQREGAKLKQHILDRLAAAEAQVASLEPLLPALAALEACPCVLRAGLTSDHLRAITPRQTSREDLLAALNNTAIISARAERSARRITPEIISRSSRSSTPAFSASAMMVRTSSSVTVSSGSPFWPSSASTSLPEASSSQTSGEATLAISAMVGATRAATRSASRSAICLGTSSPMISER